MEKFDKILELLEKKSLTEAEKKLLIEFSNSDEEIISFINIYKKLNSSLTVSGHIPTDLLASYLLLETGDEQDNNLILLIRNKIKSHLAECSDCLNEYNILVTEYSEIQEHVGKSISRDSKVTVKESEFISFSIFRRTNALKYAFATLTVLIVSYFGLFLISSSLTPDYKKNIFTNEQEDFYKTRGRTSPLFQKGLDAIDKKDYQKAIEFLSQDINEHQNEKSIFYTHYIIGITYLKASESDFIGLFKSYDKEKVNLAIDNLKESINKNNSGDYESLKLDSYYYMGKAYLLNDNKDSAFASLQRVIEGKGRYSKEAGQLLSDLEKN